MHLGLFAAGVLILGFFISICTPIENQIQQAVKNGEFLEKAIERKEFFKKAWIKKHYLLFCRHTSNRR